MILPVSFVIIYNDKDKDKLEKCVAALPGGCEVVLFYNKPGDKYNLDIFKDTVEGLTVIKTAQYEYPKGEFSFSMLRNEAKKLATRKWIFSLDADEILMYDENEFEAISRLPESVGLIGVTIVSHYFPNLKTGFMKKEAVTVYRMHLNDPRINWENRCHEQILNSGIVAGYDKVETTITLKHEGYYIEDSDELEEKLNRNLELMFKDLSENPTDAYLRERTFSHFLKLHQIGKINILQT